MPIKPDLLNQLDDLQDYITGLENELSTAEADDLADTETIAKLQEQVNALNTLIAQLRTSVTALEAENERLRGEDTTGGGEDTTGGGGEDTIVSPPLPLPPDGKYEPGVVAKNAQAVWDLKNDINVGCKVTPTKKLGTDQLPAGVSVVNGSGGGLSWKTVNITGPNAVLDGWDLTGAIIFFLGPRNTMRNCLVYAPNQIWKTSTSTKVYVPYAISIGTTVSQDVSDNKIEYCDILAKRSTSAGTAILVNALAKRLKVRNNFIDGFSSDPIKSLSASESDADRPEYGWNHITIGAWNNPSAHFNAITVARGGAHIHHNHFNLQTYKDASGGSTYGLNNAVRIQVDTVGWRASNITIEGNIVYGHAGIGGGPVGGYMFQSVIRDGTTVGPAKYIDNIFGQPSYGYMHPGSAPKPAAWTGNVRLNNGAPIANPQP